MPLGSPLPPPLPLPLPPPPRPSRLSWPRPRCLPRTIMPSTAAGRGHWAAAAGAPAARSGPGGHRMQEALRVAVRGCSFRPLGGLAGTMNRGRANSQTALLVAGVPGKSLPLGCCCRRRRLPGHGPVRLPGQGGSGEGSWELSFLPFFEIKILSSGRSAGGGSGRLCCQPPRARRRTWASGVQTPPGGTSPRRRPGLALGDARPPRGHLLPPALGKRRQQGRGCGRCWRGRVSRAGACTDCAQRPPRSRSRPPATPGRAGRRGGPFPPRRFTERGPEPRRHALPDRAPHGPPQAVGASPSPSPPPRLGPAAAELSRDRGP